MGRASFATMFFASVLGTSVVGASTLASGQDDGEGAESYDALIERAVAHFGAHRFGESRALFRSAHELRPSARTLRGLGMTAYELGEHAEAYRVLTAALDDERNPLSSSLREQVEGLRERAGRRIALLELRMSPAEASLSVDGRPPELLGGRLLLGLGPHRVEARAPEHEPLSVSVEIEGGERAELVLELSPIAPASSEPPLAAPLPPVTAPRPPRSGERDVLSPAVLIAGGASSAIASVMVGLLGWHESDGEIARCEEAGLYCTNGDALRVERDAAAGVTIGTALLGASALTLGLTWVLVEEQGGGAAARCAPAGPGLLCTVHF